MTRSAALLLVLCACAPPPPAPSPAPQPAAAAAPDSAAAAEAPPSTDIWVADLHTEGGALRVGTPRNLTRRPGYDNQPAWTPDGRALLFTRIGADGQAEAFRLDVGTGVARQLTRTPESEYSPTPLADGGFSAVRVEADSTQRLWRFRADGTNPRLVFPEIAPVGYHAWADSSTAALFVLGEPATLRLADARTGESREVARGIGRSLNPIPGRRAISFIQINADSTSTVMELDATNGAVRPLVRAVDGGDFHAWTPDGMLLMASGSTIYAWRTGEAGWTPVADLAPLRISRIGVSPRGDRIALVAAEAP